MKTLVLLSGGLDSAANLAIADHFDTPVLALTVDYGQQAAPAEIRAAGKLAAHYGVPHRVIDLPWLGGLGGSALTEKTIAIPEPESGKLDEKEAASKTAKAVWVPNRNGVLINTAAAVAESMGAQQVVVGFNREEAATFPDNSSQFLGTANLALKYSTAGKVKLACYTDMMVKREIVEALRNLPKAFPFELVWSCYRDGEKMCGKCESCRRFIRATTGGGNS